MPGFTGPVCGTLITTRHGERISRNRAASSRILEKSSSKGLFSSTEMSHPGPRILPSSFMTSSRSRKRPPMFASGLFRNRS